MTLIAHYCTYCGDQTTHELVGWRWRCMGCHRLYTFSYEELRRAKVPKEVLAMLPRKRVPPGTTRNRVNPLKRSHIRIEQYTEEEGKLLALLSPEQRKKILLDAARLALGVQ